MQYSSNYRLKLMDGTDPVKRQDFVDNFTTIDTTLGNKAEKSHNHDDRYYTLKDAKAIPENANLNNYVEFGNYQCESAARAKTLSNCPYTIGGFVLHVERTTGSMEDYCRQTLVCNGDGVTFVRNKISGTWNNWVRVQYMYTELSQLGLTYGNTLEEVIKKMASNSICIIIFNNDNKDTKLGKQMPYTYGTLFINKYDGSRTMVEFNKSANSTVTVEPVTTKYYCNYNSTTERVSEWVAYATSNQISRPNILINGDFQIWQRGTSITHTHAQYCADRWMMYMGNANGKVTWSKTDNGIKATVTTANTDCYTRIWQPLDSIDREQLKGKTLTYTIRYRSTINKAYLLTCQEGILLPKSADWNTVCYTVKFSNSNQWFAGVQFGDANLSASLNEYLEIDYIKVEVGEYSTPFVAKPRSQEIEDCKRYFVPMTWNNYTWHHGFGQNNWLFIPLPNEMRTAPTLWGGASVPANWSLCSNGSAITPTALTVRTIGGNGVLLQFTGSFKNNHALIGFYNSATLGGFDAEIY